MCVDSTVLDLFRLDQQVALVTGVGRGIGQALAVGLAEVGADIAGLYRRRYKETQAQVESLGQRFLPVQCDLQKKLLKTIFVDINCIVMVYLTIIAQIT